MTNEEHIQRIYSREKELHTGRLTKTLKPKPDLLGYDNEDLMLSDYMVAFNNLYINKNPHFVRNVFHIENEGNFGGSFGSFSGAVSKGKGKKKGVLDVECVYLGLMSWMEFKTNEGKFSDEQILFIQDMVSNGIDVFIICNNFDLFMFVIKEIWEKRISLGGGIWKSIEQVKNKLNS